MAEPAALAAKYGALVEPDPQELAAKYGAVAAPAEAAPANGVVEKALNYHTGYGLLDASLGLIQGAARGAIQTVHQGGKLLDKIPALKAADDAYWNAIGKKPPTEEQWRAVSTPNGIGQGTGKFLEQAAEFAVPAARAAKAVKGGSLAARAAAQAGVGAGVSAVQSGGDPTATVIGGVMGGASELGGAAIGKGRELLDTPRSPSLTNFSEAFGGATPTQKARISQALPVLQRDGIVPPASVHEMQDIIKGKVADLGEAYNALDPAIRARELDPRVVVGQLRKVQSQYTRRGVVIDEPAYRAIQDQIDKISEIAMNNGGVKPPPPVKLYSPDGVQMSVNSVAKVPGKLNLDDLIQMKQNANGRTTWNSPDTEKSLWKNIGDVYRATADALAPETTPLNQSYQKYKDLEQIIDQNIARGKGTTPSGLDLLLKQAAFKGAGTAAGATIGGHLLGSGGAAVGAVLGSQVGSQLGEAASQALRNAVDSGAFQSLTPMKQGIIRAAAKMGDNATVLKILGNSAAQETAVKSR